MFGYDEAELEKLRRPKPAARAWVIALELLLALPVALGLYVVDVFNDPARVNAVMDRALRGALFDLNLRDVVLLPVGRWRDPTTWRLMVTDFAYRPYDPKKPDWSARRITATVPSLRRGPTGRILHLRHAHGDGLAIHAHQQRPPKPWTPRRNVIDTIAADVVEVHGASFDAPADPPIGEAVISGIDGLLEDLTYRPGARELSAHGSLRLAAFRTGSVAVSDLELPGVTIDASTLRFAGSFRFLDTPGKIDGIIETFHTKPKNSLHVQVAGVSLGDVVTTATGADLPIDGLTDLDLRVEAGGERPRGASILNGTVVLREGVIELPRNTRYILLDLLRILPWVKVDADNRVSLETMRGRITFTRGTATLKELEYPVGKRALRVDGRSDHGELWFLLRLMPADGVLRGTLGAVLTRSTDGVLDVRVAEREDHDRPEPWVPRSRADASELEARDPDKPRLFPKRRGAPAQPAAAEDEASARAAPTR